MSLVEYASSDDDVSEEEVRANKENEPEQVPQHDPQPPTRPQTQAAVSSSQQPQSTAHSSAPSVEKLPDASMLLNSPVFSSNMMSAGDHSSRVAAALAETASRKRESDASASSIPRSKVPRGNLTHSKNIPETVGGMLVPPQLSGRSNVVTEDVGKLFVKKQADPSPNSSQHPVQLDTTKRKLRGLGFSRQEDVLLVQGWLATSTEVVQIKGEPKTTYWGRVTEYFHNHKTFGSDREDKSLQQRWGYIQGATKKFCECVTQVENDHKNGVNEQDKFFYAKQLYEKLEKKKFYFDHCWRLLKNAPKWVDDMQKPKKRPSNRRKLTSTSSEFSSPSSSESLIDLIEDDAPNTESGNTERPPVRKDIPSSGNMERPPIRKIVVESDCGNVERPLVRANAPGTDFVNMETPLMRTDVPNTDFGNRPIRQDVSNTDFGNTGKTRTDALNTDLGNMERSAIRKDVATTVFGNMERLPIRTEVPTTDFGLAERPQINKAEKLKIKDHKKDDASKQVVDLLHMKEKWRDQVNKEKRKYRLKKLEILREQLEMDKERLRLEREDKEERIMLMNISIMPPELQQYYHRRRMEILARGMTGV